MAAYEEEADIMEEAEIRKRSAVPSRHAASRNYTDEDLTDDVQVAAPARKRHTWVVLSFGLLCIVQAAVNISLRLVLFSDSSATKSADLEASIKNLTEERDTLKRMLDVSASQQHSVADDRRIIRDIEASLKTVTEERDKLKRSLLVIEANNKNLTGQRDELMQKMNDFVNNLNNGWRYHEGSLYYISTNKKNWQESRDFCRDRGAQLVIINSRNEQEFIRSLQKNLWIGLSDTETEGVWKWVDGTRLTQSYWRSGEPNSHRGTNEDCVDTKFYTEENSWNDAPCETENLWVCEKKMSE